MGIKINGKEVVIKATEVPGPGRVASQCEVI